MALALKEAFEGRAMVLTPDLPLHPKEALKAIRSLAYKERPDLLVGNSCGRFSPRCWRLWWAFRPCLAILTSR